MPFVGQPCRQRSRACDRVFEPSRRSPDSLRATRSCGESLPRSKGSAERAAFALETATLEQARNKLEATPKDYDSNASSVSPSPMFRRLQKREDADFPEQVSEARPDRHSTNRPNPRLDTKRQGTNQFVQSTRSLWDDPRTDHLRSDANSEEEDATCGPSRFGGAIRSYE